MVFSTHLAELKEEVQFLKNGKGKMLAYLKRIGRDTPSWKAPGVTPVRYFKDMGMSDFRTVKIDNGSVVRLKENTTNGWTVSL